MRHFLGTRFNLKVPDWDTTKNGEIVLNETWLKSRFELFEKFCLPSVKNQTNQNFIWCVFFDVDTPEIYKQRINSITNDYTNFQPVFVDGSINLTSAFRGFIQSQINEGETHIITTRMDNDDLIHKDFIKIIQSLYQPLDGAVIDIKNGFQVTLDENNPQIRGYLHPFNAFLSVIEETKSIETVYSKMHYDWKEASKIIGYKKRKLWIELVHETNKVNHTLSYLKKPFGFNKDDFGLSNDFLFRIDVFDVLKTNSLIEFRSFLKKTKEYVKFIKKLPKRSIRFVRKKLKNV